jgi:putative radical SAM enzyme (TIGR03279 family)
MQKHTIKEVLPGSIADELGVQPGDRLVSIGGREVADRMDYEALCASAALELCFEDADGGEYWADVEKDEDEGLGLVFETPLMSKQRGCRNKCVFCFIDQLPKGLRSSLYFKDDDWRLSLMTGNYITLTNVDDDEFARMLRLKAGPLYISVHATEPVLRGFMLGQPGPAPILPRLRALCDAGIRFHVQIVLCPGLNDGDALDKTLADLWALRPAAAASVAVVPVGVTRYREGLYPLRPFTAEDAAAVIGQVEAFQGKSLAESGDAFVFLADEFYLRAGRPIPPAAHYGDFAQLEDGIGMTAALRAAFEEELSEIAAAPVRTGRLSVATGVLAAPLLKELAVRVPAQTDVYAVPNDFFGPEVTVAGLVTGRDVINALHGRDLGDRLLIPESMLRAGEPVFLDDVTTAQVRDALGVPVQAVPVTGDALCRALWGIKPEQEWME